MRSTFWIVNLLFFVTATAQIQLLLHRENIFSLQFPDQRDRPNLKRMWNMSTFQDSHMYICMGLNIPQVYLMSKDMCILSIYVHLLITTTYAIQIFYNIVDSKWQGSHLTHILIWSTAFFFMLIHIYICTHAFVMSVISLVLLLYLCLLLVFQSCLCILFVWNLYPILKWFLLSSN